MGFGLEIQDGDDEGTERLFHKRPSTVHIGRVFGWVTRRWEVDWTGGGQIRYDRTTIILENKWNGKQFIGCHIREQPEITELLV